MRCPNCQAPINENDLFCGECGRPTSLDVLTPSSSQRASQPPPMPGPPPAQPPPSYNQPAFPPPQTPAPAPPPPASYSPAPPPPVSQGAYAPPPPVVTARPQKKSSTGCIIAIVAVLALACCSIAAISFLPGIAAELLPDLFDILTPTPSIWPPTTDPNDFITPIPPTTGGLVELTVYNNLGDSICYLYISPADSDDWGEDWLFDLGSIPGGTTASFWVASGQTVDIMVEDCFGETIDVQYGVYVYPEGIDYTLDPIN